MYQLVTNWNRTEQEKLIVQITNTNYKAISFKFLCEICAISIRPSVYWNHILKNDEINFTLFIKLIQKSCWTYISKGNLLTNFIYFQLIADIYLLLISLHSWFNVRKKKYYIRYNKDKIEVTSINLTKLNEFSIRFIYI